MSSTSSQYVDMEQRSLDSQNINQIHDEKVLKNLWQQADDCGERRKIRSRMFKLREERLREMVKNDEENLGMLSTTQTYDQSSYQSDSMAEESHFIKESSSERKSSLEVSQEMSVSVEMKSKNVSSDEDIIEERVKNVSKGRSARYQEALSNYAEEKNYKNSRMSPPSKSNYSIQSNALKGVNYQSMKHKEIRDSISPTRMSMEHRIADDWCDSLRNLSDEDTRMKYDVNTDRKSFSTSTKEKSPPSRNSNKITTARNNSKEINVNSSKKSNTTNVTSSKKTGELNPKSKVASTKKEFVTEKKSISSTKSPSPSRSAKDSTSTSNRFNSSKTTQGRTTKSKISSSDTVKETKNEYQGLDKYISDTSDYDDIIKEEEEITKDEFGNDITLIIQTRRRKDGKEITSRRVARSTKIVENESDIDEILVGNPDHEIVSKHVEVKEDEDGGQIKIITELRRRPDGIEYETRNVLKTTKIYDYEHSEDIEFCDTDTILNSEESTEKDEQGTITRIVTEIRRKPNGLEYKTKRVYKGSSLDAVISPSESDEILSSEVVEEKQSDGNVVKIIIEKRRTRDGLEYTNRQVYRSRKMTLSGIDLLKGVPSVNNSDVVINKKEKEDLDDKGAKIKVVTEMRKRSDGSTYSFDYILRSLKGKESEIENMSVIEGSSGSHINVNEGDELIKEDVKEELKKDGSIVRTIIQRRRNNENVEYLRHQIMKIPKLPEPELFVGSLDDEVIEGNVKENILEDGTHCKAITERRRSSTTGAQYTLRRMSKVFQHHGESILNTDIIIDENATEEDSGDGVLIKTVVKRYQRPDGNIYTTHDVQKSYKHPILVKFENNEDDELIDRSYEETEVDDEFIVKTILETRCRSDGTHYTVERTEKVSKYDEGAQSSFKGSSVSVGSPGDTVIMYEEHDEPADDGTVIKTILELRRRKDGSEYTNKTILKSTRILVPDRETSYVVITGDSKTNEDDTHLLPSLDDEIVYTRKKSDVDEKGNSITVVIETRRSKVTGEKYNLTKKIHTTDVVMTEHGEKVLSKKSQPVQDVYNKGVRQRVDDRSNVRRDLFNSKLNTDVTRTKSPQKTSPNVSGVTNKQTKVTSKQVEKTQSHRIETDSISSPFKPSKKPNVESVTSSSKKGTDVKQPLRPSSIKIESVSKTKSRFEERASPSSPSKPSGDKPKTKLPNTIKQHRSSSDILQKSDTTKKKVISSNSTTSERNNKNVVKKAESMPLKESPRDLTPKQASTNKKYDTKSIDLDISKSNKTNKTKDVTDTTKKRTNQYIELKKNKPLTKENKHDSSDSEDEETPIISMPQTPITEGIKSFSTVKLPHIEDVSSEPDSPFNTCHRPSLIREPSESYSPGSIELIEDQIISVDDKETSSKKTLQTEDDYGFYSKTKSSRNEEIDSTSATDTVKNTVTLKEERERNSRDYDDTFSAKRRTFMNEDVIDNDSTLSKHNKNYSRDVKTNEFISRENRTSTNTGKTLEPVKEPVCVRKYIHPLGSDSEEDEKIEKKSLRRFENDGMLSSTHLVKSAMEPKHKPQEHETTETTTSVDIKEKSEDKENTHTVRTFRDETKSSYMMDYTTASHKTSERSPTPVGDEGSKHFTRGNEMDNGTRTAVSNRIGRTNSKKIIYEELKQSESNLPSYLSDIDQISNIEVLETLLSKAETYDERRIIRARIRTLKKTDSNYKVISATTTTGKVPGSGVKPSTQQKERPGITTQPTKNISSKSISTKTTSNESFKKREKFTRDFSPEDRSYGYSDVNESRFTHQKSRKSSSEKNTHEDQLSKRSETNELITDHRVTRRFSPEKESPDRKYARKTSGVDEVTKITHNTARRSPEKEISGEKSSRKSSAEFRVTTKMANNTRKSSIEKDNSERYTNWTSNVKDVNRISHQRTRKTSMDKDSLEEQPVRKSSFTKEATKFERKKSHSRSPEKEIPGERTRKTSGVNVTLKSDSKSTRKTSYEKDSTRKSSNASDKTNIDTRKNRRLSSEKDSYDSKLNRKSSDTAITIDMKKTRRTSTEKDSYNRKTDDKYSGITETKKFDNKITRRSPSRKISLEDKPTRKIASTNETNKMDLSKKTRKTSTEKERHEEKRTRKSSDFSEDKIQKVSKTSSEKKTLHHSSSTDKQASRPTRTQNYCSKSRFSENKATTATKKSEENSSEKPYVEPLRHQRNITKRTLHLQSDVDKVISPYGVGPTDENGVPLFGLRALKKKTQANTEPKVEPKPEKDREPKEPAGASIFGLRSLRNTETNDTVSHVTETERVPSDIKPFDDDHESSSNSEEEGNRSANFKEIVKLHESKVVEETSTPESPRIKPKKILRDNFEPAFSPTHDSQIQPTWDVETDLSTRSQQVDNIIARHEHLTNTERSTRTGKKRAGILKRSPSPQSGSEFDKDKPEDIRVSGTKSQIIEEVEEETNFTKVSSRRDSPSRGGEKPLSRTQSKRLSKDKTNITSETTTSTSIHSATSSVTSKQNSDSRKEARRSVGKSTPEIITPEKRPKNVKKSNQEKISVREEELRSKDVSITSKDRTTTKTPVSESLLEEISQSKVTHKTPKSEITRTQKNKKNADLDITIRETTQFTSPKFSEKVSKPQESPEYRSRKIVKENTQIKKQTANVTTLESTHETERRETRINKFDKSIIDKKTREDTSPVTKQSEKKKPKESIKIVKEVPRKEEKNIKKVEEKYGRENKVKKEIYLKSDIEITEKEIIDRKDEPKTSKKTINIIKNKNLSTDKSIIVNDKIDRDCAHPEKTIEDKSTLSQQKKVMPRDRETQNDYVIETATNNKSNIENLTLNTKSEVSDREELRFGISTDTTIEDGKKIENKSTPLPRKVSKDTSKETRPAGVETKDTDFEPVTCDGRKVGQKETSPIKKKSKEYKPQTASSPKSSRTRYENVTKDKVVQRSIRKTETPERKIGDSMTSSLQSLCGSSNTVSLSGSPKSRKSSPKSKPKFSLTEHEKYVENLLLNSNQYTRCTKRVRKAPVVYDYTYVINTEEAPAGGGENYSIYFGPKESAPQSCASSVVDFSTREDINKTVCNDSVTESSRSLYKDNVDISSSNVKETDIQNTSDSYNKRYSTDTYDDRYVTETYDDKRVTDSYDDKYVTETYDNKRVNDSYDNKYVTETYDDKYVTDSYDDKYVSETYDDKYYTDSYDDKYVTETYDDKYVTDSYDDKYVNESYTDKYVSDSYDDNHVTESYEKHITDSCDKCITESNNEGHVSESYNDRYITDSSDNQRNESFNEKYIIDSRNESDDTYSNIRRQYEDTVKAIDKKISVSKIESSDLKISQNLETEKNVNNSNSFGKYETFSDIKKQYENTVKHLSEEYLSQKHSDYNQKNISKFNTRNEENREIADSSMHRDSSYDSNKYKDNKVNKTYYDGNTKNVYFDSEHHDRNIHDTSNLEKKYTNFSTAEKDETYNEKISTEGLRQNEYHNVLNEKAFNEEQKYHYASNFAKSSEEHEKYIINSRQMEGERDLSTGNKTDLNGRLVSVPPNNSFPSTYSKTESKSWDDGQMKTTKTSMEEEKYIHSYDKMSSDTVELHSSNQETKRSETANLNSNNRSFLNDRTKVTGFADTISRMAATDHAGSGADPSSGDEAKSLLNKFLGAQIIMSGVESLMGDSPNTQSSLRISDSTQHQTGLEMNREIHHQENYSYETQKESESHSAFKTSTSNETNKEIRSSDIVQGVKLSEVTDDSALNQLLHSCEEYEERRRVRLRLKALTAEKNELQKQLGGLERDGIAFSSQRNGVGVSGSKTVEGRVPGEQKSISAFQKFKQLEYANKSQSQSSSEGPKGSEPLFQLSSSLNRSASGVKDMILTWCQCRTRGYQGINIENFSTSWNNGLAFCALIHHFYPDAFDFNALDAKNRRHNFSLAFRVADERADVMPLLDVEDMVMMKKPDWKCVFTYVQSLYKTLKDK